MTTGPLSGRKIAFLATDGVQEEELAQPWEAVRAAGGEPVLVSNKSGNISSTIRGRPGRSFQVNKVASEVSDQDFDALVIPGGVKSPDTLRMDSDAVMFVRGFMEHDKPVAAICHGPWLLVEADVVRGRTVTSYPSLQTDLRNAGATWVDKPVFVDQKLVTSRTPADLSAFNATLVATLSNAIEERRIDSMVEQTFPASDPLPGPGAG